MTNSLKFATKTAQQQIFTVGDRKFFATRMNGEEELIYQEHDIMSSTHITLEQKIDASVSFLHKILRRRVAEGTIDEEWVARNVNADVESNLILFLRTGHNGPGLVPKDPDAFQINLFEVEIGDRKFGGKALSYQDLKVYSTLNLEENIFNGIEAIKDEPLSPERIRGLVDEMSGKLTSVHQQLANSTALALNERILDGGDSITGDWILQQLTLEEVNQLQSFIMKGYLVETEEDDPKGQGSEEEKLDLPHTVN